MPVVYGMDFSELGGESAGAAAAIAHRMQRELFLVHVIEGAALATAAGAPSTAEGHAMALLSAQAARLTKAYANLSVHLAVLRGSAVQSLVEFAETKEASLLTVSSQGHRTAPLFRVGGTSERVALESRRPVMVLRQPQTFERWALAERPLRVLVGVDDSESAGAAIEWVKRLRRAGPCDLIFANVYHTLDARRRYGIRRLMSWVEKDEQLEGLISRDMTAKIGDVPGSGDVQIRPELGVGRLADHLLDVAERERADLVVVGTHHRMGLRRLASVSGGALHFGRMSVACIPAAPGKRAAIEQPPEIHRVLVPTDFSPFANGAILQALSLISEGKSHREVYLLHVVPTRAPWSEEEQAALASRLRELVPPAAARMGVAVRTEVVRSDDVAEAIRGAAERLAADVICIGSHGRSGVAGAVLGSVAQGVVSQSRRPVLVVRPPVE